MEVDNNATLFEVNENGEIIYNGGENTASDSDVIMSEQDENLFSSEGVTDGEYVDSYVDSGDISATEMESEEVSEEVQETMVVSLGDDALPVVLSDEVTTALLNATTPASGTLANTTLDYFDRIVSGLPYDAVYVAYRTDEDSNYDGVLYYSEDYSISGDSVTFEGEARQVHVERVSSSGYSTTTRYTEYEADGVSIDLSRSGDVVYYSNVQVGFPILGGFEKPFELSPFLVVGLIAAMAVVVLQKLILKR